MRNRIILLVILLVAGAGIYFALFNKKPDTPPDIALLPPPTPELKMSLTGQVYAHDTGRFIQGLEFYKGLLVEGTGQYGQSKLLKYDYQTGKIVTGPKKLNSVFFGEGITVFNGKIYQLTYRENKVLLYDAETLDSIGSMEWKYGEGYGLTHDSTSLIASNGSNIIYFLDPANLATRRTLNISDENGAVNEINELEYVNGFIYANVWMTDDILKIDAQTGKLVARRKLTGLLPGYDAPAQAAQQGDSYLNGIAYNPDTKTFLITGKNWPTMFEVKMD